MGDVAEFARRNEVASVHDKWRPEIVVSDSSSDTGFLRHFVGCDGVFGFAADGLLAEHGLPRGTGRLNHGEVQHIGCRDPDDVDVVRCDCFPPVGHGTFETEVANGTLTTGLLGVCTDDEHRIK